MYLFKLNRIWYCRLILNIYIPLCIYFNTSGKEKFLDPHKIYIPLCIYFNLGSIFRTITCDKFTFHYVSISTLAKEPGSYFGHWFTFHYVSISTNATVHTDEGDIHLHSTMYLFQREQSGIYDAMRDNLHSTMYLFQPFVNNGFATMAVVFTFHYVSISTCTSDVIRACASWFTFHYVSI